MNRKSVLYRLVLLIVVLAILGGGGYWIYRYLTPSDLAAEHQKSAEKAYNEGKQFLDAKDGEKAKNSFNTAKVLTDKAPDAVLEDGKKQKTADQGKKLVEQNSRLLWLKAQIFTTPPSRMPSPTARK